MDDVVFRLLEQQDWEALSLRVLRYAHGKVQRLSWSTGKGKEPNLPQGMGAEDLALEAITRVWQGTRTWDPDKQPDLVKVLYDTVDSLVSHLMHSREHRVRKDQCFDEDVFDKAAAPGSGEVDESLEQAFFNEALATLEDDPELVRVFELCFDGVTKPVEIAKSLSIPVDRVSRLKEKMKRRLRHLRDSLKRGELV